MILLVTVIDMHMPVYDLYCFRLNVNDPDCDIHVTVIDIHVTVIDIPMPVYGLFCFRCFRWRVGRLG